jgi:hypothetical protein
VTKNCKIEVKLSGKNVAERVRCIISSLKLTRKMLKLTLKGKHVNLHSSSLKSDSGKNVVNMCP